MLEVFDYGFMQRAFLAGIMIALLASSLGIFVVVKRYSMLSDSLAHISLIGVALGFLFSISTTFLAILVSIFFASIIEYLRIKKHLYSDSVLAIFLSGSLAIAIIIVSLADSFNTSLFDFLFGSIVAIDEQDLYTILGFGIVTILFVAHYYKKLLFVAFDEEVAKSCGINATLLNFVLVMFVAILIGLSIKIVGALLIGALMIIPVVTAMNFGAGFFKTSLIAISLSLLSVIAGLLLSFYVSLPSGATIVVVALLFFILSLFIKR